jgi:hypothetical protein
MAAAASSGVPPGSDPPRPPLRLAIRAIIAAVLALVVLQVIPGTPAAPADVLLLVLWFTLTGRKDLAPPPER